MESGAIGRIVVYDVWDESWVKDTTVDQRNKTSLTAGFSAYSIAEAWEWQSQLNRKVDNDDCVVGRLYCDLCARSGMSGILIPNSRYEHELWHSTKWYISGFIAGFCENRWLSFEGIWPSECRRLGTDGSTISSLVD